MWSDVEDERAFMFQKVLLEKQENKIILEIPKTPAEM